MNRVITHIPLNSCKSLIQPILTSFKGTSNYPNISSINFCCIFIHVDIYKPNVLKGIKKTHRKKKFIKVSIYQKYKQLILFYRKD